MPQPKLFRIIDKAVFEYRMIEDGDRILIGASGGKDSTALVEYFAARKKQGRDRFDFTALHVSTEIAPAFDRRLLELFAQWNVFPETVNVGVLERLKPGRRMNCWWCSTQRRTELNAYAIAHGYNKIALGHHMDDILETLLMNALGKGELSTMPPRLQYEKYPVTVVRPLCFSDVDTIVAHAAERGYISATCTCSYQDNSGRKSARARLAQLTGGSYAEKRRLFESLRNIKREYLP
ncbi:tRNA 2-thiocytidine biosynthesis TtcA family protein [Treponema brennaborense]|uniref:PP-loop domain protein n=1 Tax=Treponema brennaborense (strain DSM 12168 / CIP 105900 / DD5/3) TaxID=906968 RepID=F4LIG5_TREBD|nr:tRNA 2-thiocytidine biosynthesis TtcA family protein [Treponema brennaborense]AEE16206.1 PP-loop domain protein [Treponema brennaborense DSM 12168]